MFQRIIVPVDGSDFSWRAFGPARALARHWDAELEVVEVVTLPDDRPLAEEYTRARLAELGAPDLDVEVLTMGDTVPSTLAEHVEAIEGSIVVMSSVGRGRSAALIGSVAEELVRATFGPVVLVGPSATVDRTDFSGELVVTVDGSDASESALPLAGALGISLGARPWILTVSEPAANIEGASYPARLARHLREQTSHEVEFEMLFGDHPADAIASHAAHLDASLIVMTTHGRTGLPRFTMGSVAMAMVHRAPCPVVVARPPHLAA
jgi:nucleotide-binding universal stress UspA family protein